MLKRMFWKIVIRLLRCQDGSYVKAVPTKDGNYIIDIHKFIPVSEEIYEWESALKDLRA